jgi:hypothetical protein
MPEPVVRAIDAGRIHTNFITGAVGADFKCAIIPSIAVPTSDAGPARARRLDLHGASRRPVLYGRARRARSGRGPVRPDHAAPALLRYDRVPGAHPRRAALSGRRSHRPACRRPAGAKLQGREPGARAGPTGLHAHGVRGARGAARSGTRPTL